jgi:NADH:ubiquinone oxidoreductase subunit 6 (subunit J)
MTPETFLFYIFSSIALISGVMVIRSKNPVHSVLFLILVFCNAAGLLILLDLDFFAMIFLVVYVGAIAVLFLFVVMMLNIKLAEIHENVLRYLPIGGLIGLIFLFEVLLVVDNDLIPVLSVSPLLTESNNIFQFSELLSFKIKGLSILFNPNISYGEYLKDLENLNTGLFSPFHGGTSSIASLGNETLVRDFQSFNYLSYTQWPSKIESITNIEALGQIIYTYYFYFFIVASLILLIAMIGAIVLTMHKGITVKRQEVYEQNNREFAKTIKKLR